MKILLIVLVLLIVVLLMVVMLFIRLAERVKKLEQTFTETIRKFSLDNAEKK